MQSTAYPIKWAEVEAPPSNLFNCLHLYPDVTLIAGLPNLFSSQYLVHSSLIGSNKLSTNAVKCSVISLFGVLSIFLVEAISDLVNSLIVKYFIIYYLIGSILEDLHYTIYI